MLMITLRMNYQDYYYTSVSITVLDYGINIYENQTPLQSEGLDSSIWVMMAEPGKTDTWQHVARCPPIPRLVSIL